MKAAKILVAMIFILGLAVPAHAGGTAQFHANLTVSTKHEAHVRVTWVTKCDGQRMRGRFLGLTPFQTTLPMPNDGVAHHCHAAVWAFNLDHHRGIPVVDVEVVS